MYLWNRIPNAKTKIAPISQFTKNLHFDALGLQCLHFFGCPVYVLDPRLQDGKKLPKWHPRSHHGVFLFLGYSREHGSNVALVLNLETGKVSPQYHIVFYDTFSTIFSDGQFTHNVWDPLVQSNFERHINFKVSASEGESVVEMPSSTSPSSLQELDAAMDHMFADLNPPGAASPALALDDAALFTIPVCPSLLLLPEEEPTVSIPSS